MFKPFRELLIIARFQRNVCHELLYAHRPEGMLKKHIQPVKPSGRCQRIKRAGVACPGSLSQGGEEKSPYSSTLSLTCNYYLTPALRLPHAYTTITDIVSIEY